MRELEEIRREVLEAKSQKDWHLCTILCRKALSTTTAEEFAHWFSLKTSLAYGLTEDESHSRKDSLEESIRIYREVLSAVDIRQHPLEWARTHLALGRAYDLRIEGDQCENGERSIFHYKQSLLVYTKEEWPVDWAAVKSEIGLGYVRRLAGWQNVARIEVIKKRRQYFLQAIEFYEEALGVFTKEEFSEEWEELTLRIASLEEALEYLDKKQVLLESRTGRSHPGDGGN